SGIIAKLPPSWRDFATSLKHKRQQFRVAELIGTLDVEEKARAKDSHGKRIESSSANTVPKENSNAPLNNNKKKKNKQKNFSKPKQTSTFKKEKTTKKGGCFVCGSTEHWASACPDRKFNQEKKSANMVVSGAREATSGYVCHSPEWWADTGANVHVGRTGALLMGNGSHARVLGVGTVVLKFTSGKTVLLKNERHVPSVKKNLVSGSQLCRDGYKLCFESNKGLFRLSLHDEVCNAANNVVMSNESYI
ncbi:hypothetical protein U9M48_001241, partial [Paspalum notatum var. saurae]